VSLREVARRAGVSHGAPAHHFPTKQALLAAYAAQSFEGLVSAIQDRIMRTTIRDPRDVLMCIGDGYIAYATENPARFEMMFRRDLFDIESADFREPSERAWSLLHTTALAMAESGLLTPEQARMLAVTCWSMVHGFASLWNTGWLGEKLATDEPGALSHQMNLFATFGLATDRGYAGTPPREGVSGTSD
jgi:AcrR family transcriptional regulator